METEMAYVQLYMCDYHNWELEWKQRWYTSSYRSVTIVTGNWNGNRDGIRPAIDV